MKLIYIASDHAGKTLKDKIFNFLQNKENSIIDLGVTSEESVDYPDYGYKMAEKLLNNNKAIGVAICGSGIGISIALNRYKWVRAALVYNIQTAELSRKHNNSNVIVFGEKLIESNLAFECLTIFLNTPFEEGRHTKRLNKLSNPLEF